MSKRYELLYEQFKIAYNTCDLEVDYWEPGMDNEILVHMKNGDSIYYEGTNRSFCYQNEYDSDGYGDYAIDDVEYRRAFSRKLRRMMLSREINQKMLSDISGINAVSLSHYMNGRNLPDVRNIKRICRALGCSFEELTDLE